MKKAIEVILYTSLSLLFILVTAFIVGNILKINSIGYWLSLIEVVIELCLIPIVIFGFLWTLEEMKKAQVKANIDIFWLLLDGNKNTKVMKTVPFPVEANYIMPRIAIRNEGDALSIHYQVKLILPFRVKVEEFFDWEYELVNNKFHLIAQSKGEKPLYPDQKTILFPLSIKPSAIRELFVIEYEIFCDRGRKKQGKLVIEFEV